MHEVYIGIQISMVYLVVDKFIYQAGEFVEINDHSGFVVEVAGDGYFEIIVMAMAIGIGAFAVHFQVFGVAEFGFI